VASYLRTSFNLLASILRNGDLNYLRVIVNMRRIVFSRRTFKKRIVALATLLFVFWFAARILFPGTPERPKWADRAVTPAQRAEVIKDVFRFAWRGYYSNAFPNDELIPLWNWYSNSRYAIPPPLELDFLPDEKDQKWLGCDCR
jgi:hypothetical protein